MDIEEKVTEILISQIHIVDGFNVRKDFDDSAADEDLENSMLTTGGNISPIGICKNGKKYELLYGERRFNAAKKLGFQKLKCIVYNPANDYEKFLIMFHENLGRKDLKWQEEIKAIKIWKDFEIKKGKTLEEFIDNETKKRKTSTRTIWRLLQLVKAIDEFPCLVKEQTRTAALKVYATLKKLPENDQEQIKKGSLASSKILKKQRSHNKIKEIDSKKAVIEELKKDVQFYKTELKKKGNNLDDICANIVKIPKEERIQKNIWLIDEVKTMVSAARSCSGFGFLDPGEGDEFTCDQCKKEDREIFDRCHWWHHTFEKENETNGLVKKKAG